MAEATSIRHQIFLSYHNQDKETAQLLLDACQKVGLSVWWDQMIPPGDDWAKHIVENLERSDMLIILFSSQSNQSTHLARELALADSRKMIVYPAFIEDVQPQGRYAYRLATEQRFNLFPDCASQIEKFVATLQPLLQRKYGLPENQVNLAKSSTLPGSNLLDQSNKIANKSKAVAIFLKVNFVLLCLAFLCASMAFLLKERGHYSIESRALLFFGSAFFGAYAFYYYENSGYNQSLFSVFALSFYLAYAIFLYIWFSLLILTLFVDLESYYGPVGSHNDGWVLFLSYGCLCLGWVASPAIQSLIRLYRRAKISQS
ncbi:MAG TPA: hypothetical protein DCL54_13175 [Alphaproteobacteria bacterium]|nr:hypothetical protein [Alphaproteobacteria bacterium]HAJ47521.1 hypothetical protein [Alphaproteobacteria bacterium]